MHPLKSTVENPTAHDSRHNLILYAPIPDDYDTLMCRNRDSDALTESNWRTALRELGGESDNVLIVRMDHWAVGWIEHLAVKQGTSEHATATALEQKLEDYPILNENDFSELETDNANEVWANCYRPAERIRYIRAHRGQFEFNSYSDMLAVVRGWYFIGYASELLS